MHARSRATSRPIAALVLVAVGVSAAASAEVREDSLADLSLEELTKLEVSSVNKKPERALDAPAAVFVITQDDIRRSGAINIPQALRLVPGLQVAQIDGNKWAISARGFNSRFANRLLVLMDGRTLYTLTFGGVFWDAQDTLIDDIERIEVIRGPGGAVWGTDAFNGVINIITKNASQTDGGLVTALSGTQQPWHVGARIGDASGDLHWRAFAKGFEQEPNLNWQDEEGHDAWRQARIGGRIDWHMSDTDTLQVTAEAYQGKSGMEVWDYDALPAFATITTDDQFEGAFANAEWTRATAHGGHVRVRGVVDYTDRDSLVFGERRNTYDLELEHALGRRGVHEFMWGASARYTSDVTQPTAIAVNPSADSLTILSGYAQDELSFLDDALHVVIGARVEHSDYVDTQFMPNLRASMRFGENTVLWAAASRGIRSASRLERDVRVADTLPTVPTGIPGAAPTGIEIWGDKQFQPEKLNAYELGLRQQPFDALLFDIAAYYHDYDDMRGVQRLPTVCAPSMTPVSANPFCIFGATKIVLPMQFTNLTRGFTRGVEATVNWSPLRDWRLIASYAYLDQRMQANAVSFGAFAIDFAAFSTGLDAENQWTLRSNLTLGKQWDWDIFLRHVDELPAGEVEAYTELNTRIAWRPRIDFEIALLGENLLDDAHVEFVSDFLELSPVSIERSVHLQARWTF